MSIIETMARAIYEQHPNMVETWELTTTTRPWRRRVLKPEPWEEAEDRHEVCLLQARAALAAMETPSKKMLDAGHDGQFISQDTILEIWQAMIRAERETAPRNATMDSLDKCPKCGTWLGPPALEQIGSSTMTRVVCVQCWEKMCAKVPPKTSEERDEGNSDG